MLELKTKHAYNGLIMKKENLLKVFTPTELSEALGITVQAIYQWPEEVPRLRQYEIRDHFSVAAPEKFKDLIAMDVAQLRPAMSPDCHTPDTAIPGTPIDDSKVREAKNGTRHVPPDVKGVMS